MNEDKDLVSIIRSAVKDISNSSIVKDGISKLGFLMPLATIMGAGARF